MSLVGDTANENRTSQEHPAIFAVEPHNHNKIKKINILHFHKLKDGLLKF